MLDLLIGIKNIQKIKNGGKANISNKQIVNSIINLIDAKNNLEADDYNKVYNIFQKFNKQKDKILMDIEMLLIRTAFIVSKFDEVAPVELYSGQESMFISKIQKEKYIEKAQLIQMINMQKETLNKAKRDLENNTVEKVVDMYNNHLINEQQKDEFINAIQSLNAIIEMAPDSIKMLEEKLKKLD